ncbi:MAG TPA: glutamate-5-semialdehyde dehydrogenase [Ruminococcaceae bacterium]|jgi:glutamate-5-semialdehyde dehydrogenase|nr:glutamate-5-semialdehyde dehydrogenase [Oscillospiraceae bacterium]HCK50338.1 glutamate-5-semialdehyde dehydrogenase [Oscillospiraceae bacterium]
MEYIETLGANAKAAEPAISVMGTNEKNRVLSEISSLLRSHVTEIIGANKLDIETARANGMSEAMIDRLTLTEQRIGGMADGVDKVISLPDPVGAVIGGSDLPNGLHVIKKRVPIGTIGIIFESRPNVTVDAATLCFKAGNTVILRGGSDAINSNKALVGLMRTALRNCGVNENAVQLVEDTSRAVANAMMRLNKYIDLLIPRGGGGLIHAVIENATIPVIQTGEGNCHVYVDESADIDMAVNIINNAKTQRPSVCNAIENILVHEKAAPELFRKLDMLWQGRVAIRGDEETAKLVKVEKIADDTDYATEFLDYRLSSKVVKSLDEAIEHINRFGTKHSECIVTQSLRSAEIFQQRIDAAAVYVNASTRFTDGFEFGLGAEIGISTQKLHARGPMGLEALTTYKYLINGNGQIRG